MPKLSPDSRRVFGLTEVPASSAKKRCSSVNIKVLFSFNNVCVEKKIVSALRELFIMLLENVFVAASLRKVLKKFGRKKIRFETTFLKK